MSITQRQIQKQQQNNQNKIVPTINSLLAEKKSIKTQLKTINSSISRLKTQNQNNPQSPYIDSEGKAKLKAISFIKKIHKQKQQFNEKKVSILQKQRQHEVQRQKKQLQQRYELQQRKKGQRISRLKKRRQQQQLAHQVRNKIDKESNKLIQQIKHKRKKLQNMHLIAQKDENKNNKNEKRKFQQTKIRSQTNPQEYDQQSSKIHSKSQSKSKSKQKSNSINHPLPKYPKTKWDQLIEQDQKALKHQLHLQSLQKKTRLQKRMQYGTLINHIFQKKVKNLTQIAQENKDNFFLSKNGNNSSNTVHVLPEIKDKRNYEKQIKQKHKVDKKKMFSGRKHAHLSNYEQKSNEMEEQRKNQSPHLDKLAQQIEKKLVKQKKNRHQTLKRIQKYEEINLDKLMSRNLTRKFKQPYKNYLGTVPIIKKPQNIILSHILNNDSLSKQQKCFQLLKKSTQIQNKVRLKLQSKKSDSKSLDLFMSNIQAKLDLLKII